MDLHLKKIGAPQTGAPIYFHIWSYHFTAIFIEAFPAFTT